MGAFDAGIRALFRDRNLALDVQYWPGGIAPGWTVRAVRAQPDVAMDYQATSIRSDSLLIDVLVSDVAQPRPNDIFVVDGDSRVVDGEPALDVAGLTWRVALVPEEAP